MSSVMDAEIVGRTSRSPKQHRYIVDMQRPSWPANDSDLIPESHYSKTPRHADLAESCAALLKWRELNKSHEPIQTNWLRAANDNESTDDYEGKAPRPILSFQTECELEMRPTVDELMAAVTDVVCEESGCGEGTRPVGGDIGYGQWRRSKLLRAPVRPITRLGTLVFCTTDYVKRDRANPPRRGQLIAWGKYKPFEKFGTPYGADAGLNSNAGDDETPVDEAIAARKELDLLKGELSPGEIHTLDAAIVCQNFKELGETLGFVGKHAERKGRKRLISAVAALEAGLKKIAC